MHVLSIPMSTTARHRQPALDGRGTRSRMASAAPPHAAKRSVDTHRLAGKAHSGLAQTLRLDPVLRGQPLQLP